MRSQRNPKFFRLRNSQEIILQTIEDIAIKEYVCALGDIIAKAIRFISRILNWQNVYLSRQERNNEIFNNY